MFFKINDKDFSNLVSGLKIGYEVLVSENSGRNAAGDTVIDVINRKTKLYVSFRPMFDSDMKRLLGEIESYVVSVSFRDSKTNVLKTIQCYIGTPEPEYQWVHNGSVLYKAFNLNFIEL